MVQSISWILKFASNLPTEESKLDYLRSHGGNNSITTLLKYAYDPAIKWLLPETDPPYTPCQYPHQEANLYQKTRTLYLFLEGGNNNLNQIKRERLFIDILETVDPQDAILLLNVKNKKIPYEGIDSKLIAKAFPGIY